MESVSIVRCNQSNVSFWCNPLGAVRVVIKLSLTGVNALKYCTPA